MTEAVRYSMPEIFAAINRRARRRADWLNSLDKRDPARIMSELENAASIYMTQPFEHNRAVLQAAITRAREIEGALLDDAIQRGDHHNEDSKHG